MSAVVALAGSPTGDVVAISDDNRRVIERECPTAPAGRIQVIHCGVDTSVFQPVAVANAGSAAGGGGDGPLEILAIGTLHEVKGQAVLVDACRELTGSTHPQHTTEPSGLSPQVCGPPAVSCVKTPVGGVA